MNEGFRITATDWFVQNAVAKRLALDHVVGKAQILVVQMLVEREGARVALPGRQPKAARTCVHGTVLSRQQERAANACALGLRLNVEANQLGPDNTSNWRSHVIAQHLCKTQQPGASLRKEEDATGFMQALLKFAAAILGKRLIGQIRTNARGGVGVKKNLYRKGSDGLGISD